jgi:hypothetical protein
MNSPATNRAEPPRVNPQTSTKIMGFASVQTPLSLFADVVSAVNQRLASRIF